MSANREKSEDKKWSESEIQNRTNKPTNQKWQLLWEKKEAENKFRPK